MTTSLPRPALIALVGVVAVAALFLMTRRGGEEAGSGPSTPPAAQDRSPGSAASKPDAKSSVPAQPRSGEKQRSARSESSSRSERRSQSRSIEQPGTLPPAVSRALDAHKVVVLLFWNRRGVDDRRVKSAVDSLSSFSNRVAVFTNSLKNVGRYARITTAVNVTQTPALIVVNPKGQARIATGYHDSASVEQYVVDALHNG